MTHQLLPSCTAPGTDVVLFIGDSVCLLIAYTEWKYPELDPLNVMRYLHGHTWGRTVHTQFWILLQITNNNKKGTHMLPRGCSCYGDSLFGVRSVSGGGLCEWTLCSGSLWIWHHHGWKRSTWASLHEASAAHSRTDMPGWLMCPLTLYGVMSLECIQINCVKSVKNEIHDEHGISFSSFLCYFPKKKALWDHPHKKAIKLNWAQNLYFVNCKWNATGALIWR